MNFKTPTADDDNRSGVNDDLRDCPDCDGEGEFELSECCGATISHSGLCFECHDHTEGAECETCEGTGEVSKQVYDSIKSEQ